MVETDGAQQPGRANNLGAFWELSGSQKNRNWPLGWRIALGDSPIIFRIGNNRKLGIFVSTVGQLLH